MAIMRFLAAVVGALFGIAAGFAISVLIAIAMARNDLFGAGFLTLVTGPLGTIFGATIGAIIGLRLSPHLRDRETKRILWRRLLFSLGVASSAILILIGVLFCTIRSDMTPPSDQRLLANFDRHEATFNALIEMLKTDEGVIRIDEDWTDPKNPETIGVPATRIVTYRRMLKDARVPRGFQSERFMFEVDFFYWMIGSAISSDTTKGYAYRTQPPIETRSSLDGYRPDPKNADDTVKVYRHIRGNWYLFYEYIPG